MVIDSVRSGVGDVLRRLDDDHSVAEARNDAVARREPPRQRRLPEVVLGDEGTGALYAPEQSPVVPGVNDQLCAHLHTFAAPLDDVIGLDSRDVANGSLLIFPRGSMQSPASGLRRTPTLHTVP